MSRNEHDDQRGSLSVEQASGILSKIFRQLLYDLGINPRKWNDHMNHYLDDPRNRIPGDKRGKSTARGNLNKALRKSNMTWDNFAKGIRFLNPIKAEFTVKLYWRNNQRTEHTFTISDDIPVGDEDENDSPDNKV